MSRVNESDQRKYFRYEVLDYAQVEPADADAFSAMIVDVGLGGLQIRCRELLENGHSCVLKVGSFDGKLRVFRTEVRHTIERKDSGLRMIGLRFAPESHDERMAVAEYVHTMFERQAEAFSPQAG